MANLSPSTGLTFARTEGGMDVPIYTNAVEGASQTYKVGSPLQWSSGLLITASASITTSNKMAGIAVFAATGTTNANVVMSLPYSSAVFMGCLQASSGGNSVDTHTLAATDVGTTMQIAKDGVSGLWFLDFTNTGTPAALVIALVDAIGTKNGKVLFKIVNGATIY